MDDREAANPLAGRRVPVFPQTRERHDAAISERERIGLLSLRNLLPAPVAAEPDVIKQYEDAGADRIVVFVMPAAEQEKSGRRNTVQGLISKSLF
jgi:hypothetical protein